MNDDDFSQMMSSNVSAVETTNNIDTNSNKNIIYSHTCNICQPKEDTYFPISLTFIKKLKKQCKKQNNALSIVSDILLTVASLFLGALLSAIISKIEFKLELIPVLFYCISPTLGAASLVACIFTKIRSKDSETRLSEKVNEYIIEPFEIYQKENSDEH